MKVYELLDKPEKWTKDVLARDAEGSSVDPNDEYAVCWCAWGAVEKCYPSEPENLAVEELIQEELGDRWVDVTCFNDDNTYEDVINLFKKIDR